MRKRSRDLTGLGALIGTTLACTTLLAGAPLRAEEPIENIVITAQRRGEKLQDVPLAVSAFSGTEIENLGFDTVRDIAGQTPNLVVTSPYGNSNPTIFLRGIGVNDYNANLTGAVGIYQDEVYIASPAAQLFQMFDLERVEVLRGPQGTLYGRNTTAGAINFLSRKPVINGELTSRGSITYGSFEEVDLDAAVGFPVVRDVAAGRVAFVLSSRSGTTENLLPDPISGETGRDVNAIASWAGRALLAIEATDRMDWLINFHGGQNRSDSRQFQSQGLLDPLTPLDPATFAPVPCPNDPRQGPCADFLGYVESPDPYEGRYNKVQEERIDLFGVSLTGNLDVGSDANGVRLTSITAYEKDRRSVGEETDASPNRLLEIDWANDSWQVSQELRATSSDESSLQWIVGGYGFYQVLQVDNAFDQLRDARAIFTALGIPNEGFDPTAPGQGPVYARQRYTQSDLNFALFGQATYSLGEILELLKNVSLTGGLRWTWDRKRLDTLVGAVEPALGFPFVETVNAHNEESWNNVSGRAAIDWKVTDQALVFVSYSRGFKSGGFNGGALFNPAEATAVDPESINAFEAGTKTDWLEGRLRLNLTGFYYDYNDLQAFTLVPSGLSTISVLANASDAKVLGLEVELGARPIDRLDIQFGLGLLDGEYKSFQTVAGDFSGNTLTKAPSISLSGIASYAFDLGRFGNVVPQISYSWKDHQFFDTSNADRLSQDAYGLVDLRLAWIDANDHVEVAFFVRNVADEVYRIDSFDLSGLGFDQIVIGEPRSFGATVAFRF